MNLTYEKCGDYLIPNIIPEPEPEGELRKFGLMRKHYLKEYKSGIYQGMVLSGKLKEHLLMVQEQAESQFDALVEQMAEREGVTEKLKQFVASRGLGDAFVEFAKSLAPKSFKRKLEEKKADAAEQNRQRKTTQREMPDKKKKLQQEM